MRLLTGRGRPGAPLPAGRRVRGTGLGFFLLATGAVLLFAVRSGSIFGLKLHVVGIVVLAAGVLRLLLQLPPAMRAGPRPDRLRRWVNPSGIDNPRVHDVQSAAAIDVAQIREDEKFFSPSIRQQDEL
jgi:hypothetical protein